MYKYCLYLIIVCKRSRNHNRQQALFKARLDGKIKTSTNSRCVQCFHFLDLSSFRFIYFPHHLVYYAFSYNFVTADSKKIRVCHRHLKSCEILTNIGPLSFSSYWPLDRQLFWLSSEHWVNPNSFPVNFLNCTVLLQEGKA